MSCRRKKKWFIDISLLSGLVFFSVSVFAQEPVIIQERFEDWAYRCVVIDQVTDNKLDQCELFQSVLIKWPQDKDKAGNQSELIEVLQVGFSRVADQVNKVEWSLFIVTPLNVHLASDFALRIGRDSSLLARYRNCNHQGCLVVIPMTQASIRKLKKATTATSAFRLLNGQNVNISFSLIGFTKAFNALVEQKIPNPDVR